MSHRGADLGLLGVATVVLVSVATAIPDSGVDGEPYRVLTGSAPFGRWLGWLAAWVVAAWVVAASVARPGLARAR